MIINPTSIATCVLGADAPVLGEHLLGHGQAGDSLAEIFCAWGISDRTDSPKLRDGSEKIVFFILKSNKVI